MHLELAFGQERVLGELDHDAMRDPGLAQRPRQRAHELEISRLLGGDMTLMVVSDPNSSSR